MARIKSGALGTLVIALLVAAASAWLGLRSNGVYCDQLAPLTVLATLSAFVMALCFRQLATAHTGGAPPAGFRNKLAASRLRGGPPTRYRQLFAALLIAAITLFGDAHFVVKYHGFCNQLQQQLHRAS